MASSVSRRASSLMGPFIRKRIPTFETHRYRGRHYESLIPDTLDIQERAGMAVNGLTGPTDPEKNHLLYFYATFTAHPPTMSHCQGDICQSKFMEALPLMRMVSGSDLRSEVDPAWMSTALSSIGPDGLVYWPAFPWAKKPDWADPSPESKQYAVPLFNGRTISAMTLYMLRDPRGPWRKEIEGVVDALHKLAIHRDDYAYFPQGAFTPNGPRPTDAQMPLGIWASFAGWTTHGLTHFYRATGYKPAGELAGKLARYICYHGKYYGAAGEFLPNYATHDGQRLARAAGVYAFDPGPPPENDFVHFQHHVVPLLGVLDYALTTGDAELAQFVRKSFEWAKAQGEPNVGYFPENIGNAEYEGAETCQLAGMIGLALKLSHGGIGDYWDDADRWIRNQFAENQLRRGDWIYHVHEAGLTTPRRRIPVSQIDPVKESNDHVPERNIGAFAGWPSANDFFAGQGNGIMHCCTGNGTRALYYIWEHILTFRNGELRINLLLNRPSKWADVHSHIPYAGQVDVHMKRTSRVAIRIPDWVDPKDATARVNGKVRRIKWEGRYAVLSSVAKGQLIEFRFPIFETVKHVDIEKQRYRLTIKGHDVVHIDPPGKFCPFYQRDHYRDPSTRWKKSQRFVSEESIYW